MTGSRISSMRRQVRGLKVAGRSPSSSPIRYSSSRRRPFATTMPRSRSTARSWLINAVRWPTRRDLARCRICASSCASLLSSTKRIVGRVAASAIASAVHAVVYLKMPADQDRGKRRDLPELADHRGRPSRAHESRTDLSLASPTACGLSESLRIFPHARAFHRRACQRRRRSCR